MGKASLKLKLTLGFATIILALAANSVVGYCSLLRLESSRETLRIADEKRKLALLIRSAMEQQRSGVRGLLLGNENSTDIAEGRRIFQDAAEKLPPLLKTETGRRIFADMMRASDPYHHLLDKEIELHKAGKTKEAITLSLSPEAGNVRDAMNAAIDSMVLRQENNRNDALDQERAAQAQTRLLLTLFGSAGLLAGLAVSIFLPRSLAHKISAMMAMIHEISVNNLCASDLAIGSQDEIGRASAALNTMKDNLRSLIQTIARTAEQVASASEEISSSASQLAQASGTQKSQATQVAVAMQEMSSTVQEVSENSNRAAEASHQAAETARHGGQIVEASLNKMRVIAASVSATARKVEELGKSSDQIGRIIGVIDDIADQTNLLALNAAIEAARAGEQGRGFAVVADEVRKLAERTTSATKEVAQMVQSIQNETGIAVAAMQQGTQQVEDGVQTTAQAGESLKQIIQMSEQVGEMITHIATAATEQASATEQVNQNVEQINRLVGESAVGAQQSAKACQDLSGLALDLQKTVATFQLEAGGQKYARGPAQPSRSTAQTRAFAASAP